MLDLCGGDTDKAVESMNHLMQEGNMEIRREDYPPGLPPPSAWLFDRGNAGMDTASAPYDRPSSPASAPDGTQWQRA